MFTEIQKRTMMFTVMLLSLLMAFMALTANTHQNAQAQTFEQHFPTYGLYCNDSETITSGKVKFDLTDTELLSHGKGVAQYEYEVAANDGEVEFAIPFLAKACELPQISVTVNGQAVEGSVWFGDKSFWIDTNFDTSNIYSSDIDENIKGTLYTIIPDNNTITISLSYNERKSFIYETSNNYSSSLSADGKHIWTLRNALSKSSYTFFVFDDGTGHSFESSCEYQTETVTCKDFIDSQYKIYEEYYDYYGGVPIGFFYSIINQVLQSNLNLDYNDLFFNSVDTMQLNAYKFSMSIEADSVISYELPISVQRNYAFKPLIYLVEQKQVGSYNTSYSIELNNNIPHIIESSVETDNKGLGYTAETTEDFYFVFSSSKNPTSTTTNIDNGINRTGLIVGIAVGGIVLIGGVALTIFFIYRRKA